MRYFLSFVFSLVLLFALRGGIAFAAQADIILSEIQITGGTGHTNDDFAELYNPGDNPVDISGFRLRYRNSKGTEDSLRVFESGSCIPSKGFYLWANKNGAFATLADTTTEKILSENYTALLYPPEERGNTVIDALQWGAGTSFPNPPANQSLVRDKETLSWSLAATPTPTKSVPCPEPEPTPAPTTVRLSEVFPNPAGDESAGEFIELYNDSDTETDLSGLILHDASESGGYTLPQGTVIPAHGYLTIFSTVSDITLNNTNETVTLFSSNKTVLDSLQYETTREGVSLNVTENGLRGGIPTPGTANRPNALPETREKVPKKGYRGMPTDFDARGKDSDGGTLKYTWDFGDGHKSYKEETTHTYEENGTYQVILKTSDGQDDILEAFTLEIESFPELDIRITALVPNPSGKDSENEWLIIENREKKAIDLKGWSIATGWKDLANHPVRDSFVVPAKSSVKLTRKTALFTLPNAKGRVELRAPDGKTLQEIEYKLKKSAEENAAYIKKKGVRWQWQNEIPKTIAVGSTENTREAPENLSTPEEPNLEKTEAVLLKENISEQIAHRKKKEEDLRKNIERLLYQRSWIDISENTLSDPNQERKEVVASPKNPVAFVEKAFSRINFTLNDLQNR